MVLLSSIFSALACAALYPVSARQADRNHIQALQREATNRFNNRLSLSSIAGDVRLSKSTDVKNITFSNPAASGEHRATLRHRLGIGWRADRGLAFYVDGTTIPEVDWDVGPSWAGLLPISGNKDETRKVSASYMFALTTFRGCCTEAPP